MKRLAVVFAEGECVEDACNWLFGRRKIRFQNELHISCPADYANVRRIALRLSARVSGNVFRMEC